MAKRTIVTVPNDILRKKCKTVDKIDKKIITLLDDMKETMKSANGVGLAAPQVGILKNIAVIDVGDGLIEIINPQIINEEGKQTDVEGCLSIPGKWGEVTRAQKVTVKALNRKAEEITIKGEGLLARALCHEIDHISGVLFTDKVERFIQPEG